MKNNPINYWYQKYLSLKAEMDKMKADAVEGYVCAAYPAAQGNVIEYSVKYPKDKRPYKFGDKVRIIVLPKEDKK